MRTHHEIMKGKLPIFSIAAAMAAVLTTLMITAATHGLTDLVFAQGAAKFGFNLTGSEEVPPVQTNATGLAEISPGHIHFGKPGENGPIVFTMFKYDPPRNEVLETGTITADKLEGPMKGMQVSDLGFAGANGSLYMNIHTVENPNGEIRGTSSVPP
jgi:hypothetical protein